MTPTDPLYAIACFAFLLVIALASLAGAVVEWWRGRRRR